MNALLNLSIEPHEAHARLAHLGSSFLFESRADRETLGRYSILGVGPVGSVQLSSSGIQVEGALPAPLATDSILDYLRRVQAFYATDDHTSPFVGGLVGQVGFEAFAALQAAESSVDPGEWPLLELGLYLDALVWDREDQTLRYVTRGGDRLPEILAALQETVEPHGFALATGLQWNRDDASFQKAVREAQESIRDGEAFQIVLSRYQEATMEGNLFPLYDWIRDAAPVPYLFHLRFPEDRELVGASPEMLVRVRQGKAEVYPIAGTRRRGDAEQEARMRAELAADAKEQAEHAMLVDLARNDLHRVCSAQSVEVAEAFQIRAFRDLLHIVSRVEGELLPGEDALSAFASCFPAGTVSGAPKVRASQILAGLEGESRGPYGGCVFYLSFNGDLDSAITIRTASREGPRLRIQAGAGVVAGSQPELESLETINKSRTLRDGIEQLGGSA